MNYAHITGSERTLTSGARIIGKASPHGTIQVTVHVKRFSDPTNARLKEHLVGSASTRGVTEQGLSQRKHLSRAEFAASFGTTPAEVQKVKKFAREHGLRVVRDRVVQRTKANQLGYRTLELRGKISAFNRAFGVKLLKVHDSRRTYRTYQGALSIPQEYQDVIENVFGLDNRPQVKPMFHPAPRLGGSRTRADAAAHSPDQIAKLYNFPSGATGKGQTIAILEFGGGARLRDLRAYFKQLGIPMPLVKFVSVGRGKNSPTGNPNGSDGEVMLDIEVAGAVAPGAKIVVYFAPNASNRSFFRTINAAAHDNINQPSIISISWGGPEDSWTSSDMTSIDEALQAAAAMGISVFVASGDAGSTDIGTGSVAHVDFPASSPFSTACGGTSMVSTTGAITETVWNDSPTSGTGGGVSDVFDPPNYQMGLGASRLTSANPGARIGRGVPDVAGNADPNTGYKVRVDGVNSVIGGTSAVAPLWAGLFALINEGLTTKGLPTAGFANTLLYSVKMAASGAFRDITVGNNDTTGKVGGYKAMPGWDACTGLGTPASGAQILDVIKST